MHPSLSLMSRFTSRDIYPSQPAVISLFPLAPNEDKTASSWWLVLDRAVIEPENFFFFFFCFRGSVARRISSGNKSCFILWDGTQAGNEKRGRAMLTRGLWVLLLWEVRTGIPWILRGDEEKRSGRFTVNGSLKGRILVTEKYLKGI